MRRRGIKPDGSVNAHEANAVEENAEAGFRAKRSAQGTEYSGLQMVGK